MKLNNRRLMSVLLLLAVTLYTVIGLTAALCEPTDPNEGEKDPYDWSDYEGEVILDDPEFFLFDDETVDENEPVPDSGESVSSSDPDAQDENTPPGAGGNADLNEEQTESTNEPASPTDEQSEGEEPPAGEPTSEPEKPVDLKSLFLVEIKVPAGWFNLPEKAVRLKITPKSETLWDKIFCRLDDGDWMEIKDRFSFQDGYYYLDLTVTTNGTVAVRLMNDAGNYFDTQKEIRIFDHRPPEVTAGIKNTMLHVVAVDDLSEVAGIQVNGLLFTTLEDGVLDVRMEEPLNSYKQLAIRAYDYAGNFSDPVTLDNPYYSEPTPTPAPTKKPTVTKQPTATPAPTSTPKATKKPNTGNDAESTKATKAPAAETTAQTEKQEPIVIILTPLPTAEPAPSPTPEIQYVPLGPGQPFTQNGNMVTRDVLYSASTNKQFIAVQSRAGQTYYMVIDYDKPIDEENEIYETYFLNLVDDRDLMSVLTDEEIVPTPTPQIIYVTPEPTQVPPPTSAPVETPVQQETKKMDSAVMLLLLVLIVLVIGGFVAWFITSQNKKQVPRIPEYDEDDEYEIDDSDEESNQDE